jgi:hypothetical protein
MPFHMAYVQRVQPIAAWFDQSQAELVEQTQAHATDRAPVMPARGILFGLALAVPLWGTIAMAAMGVARLVQ